jgi:hypothetical protein
VRDDKGKAMIVRYEAVNTMPLNEFLKEHGRVQELRESNLEQKRAIAEQKKEIAELKRHCTSKPKRFAKSVRASSLRQRPTD